MNAVFIIPLSFRANKIVSSRTIFAAEEPAVRRALKYLPSTLVVVLFSALAVAQELPQGWRRPTLAEVKGQWRTKSGARFLQLSGDFDGDGKPDIAELLVSSSAKRFGLFVRLSSQHNEWQSVHEADGPLDRLAIAIVHPKKYVTLCGSD